jgi:hypothetical protein
VLKIETYPNAMPCTKCKGESEVGKLFTDSVMVDSLNGIVAEFKVFLCESCIVSAREPKNSL